MLADKLRAAAFSAPPVFEIANYSAAKNDVGSIVINAPSGIESGDLLLMCVCNGAAASFDPASFSTPSGWTSRRTSSDTPHISVYSKVATASEPSSYTVTWGGSEPDGSSGIILRITKANYSTIGTIGSVGVGTAAVVAPSITSTAGLNTLFIVFGARGETAQGSSYTSGWTEYYDSDATSGGDSYVGLVVATKPDADGGSSSNCTVTFNTTSGSGQAVIVAVTEA